MPDEFFYFNYLPTLVFVSVCIGFFSIEMGNFLLLCAKLVYKLIIIVGTKKAAL